MKSRSFILLSVSAILAAAILPYISTWSDPFIADDWGHLGHSKYMTSEAFVHNMSFHPDDIYYRPVAIAWFHMNYLVFGLNPTGHHVAKGLLFAGCSLLLFAFVLRATGLRAGAVAAGLVFALHPVNTSCAVWLSTHGNVLSVFFALLALWLFVEAVKRTRGRGPLYAGFLAAMLLCLGSYEMCYSLPALVLLADFLLLRPKGRLRSAASRFLRWHLPYLLIAAAFFLPRFVRMNREYQPPDPLATALAGLPQTADMIFLPISRMELHISDWMRSAPVWLGLLLLFAVLARSRELRPAAVFAVAWVTLGAAPAALMIPPGPEFGNLRFLLLTSAGFGMLLGVFVSLFLRTGAGRVAAVFCLAAVLGAYTWLSVHESVKWSLSAKNSQTIIDTLERTCRDMPVPFRVVFITYPEVRGVFDTDPNFAAGALIVLRPPQALPQGGQGMPYYKGGFDFTQLPPELCAELRRWFAVRLDSNILYGQKSFADADDVYTIRKEDLERTFFFYWEQNTATLADCTPAMRERLTSNRKSKLFSWTADDSIEIPMEDMKTKSPVMPYYCSFSKPQGKNGLLYITTNPGMHLPPMIRINLEESKTPAAEFDQIEFYLSAASKKDLYGYLNGYVAWRFEDEEELPPLLERRVPFSLNYHMFHEMRQIRVPLAHRFLGEGERRVVTIYIILSPGVSEYALRSIRLSRFNEK